MLKAVGIDASEAIETVVEQDMWKVRQVKKSFGKFVSAFLEFLVSHPEDFCRYLVVYTALLLLFLALDEFSVVAEEKLKALREEVLRLAEELEAFTLTFMLMTERVGKEELEVTGEARSREELRRVLGLE